jgi:hypothetical protein
LQRWLLLRYGVDQRVPGVMWCWLWMPYWIGCPNTLYVQRRLLEFWDEFSELRGNRGVVWVVLCWHLLRWWQRSACCLHLRGRRVLSCRFILGRWRRVCAGEFLHWWREPCDALLMQCWIFLGLDLVRRVLWNRGYMQCMQRWAPVLRLREPACRMQLQRGIR